MRFGGTHHGSGADLECHRTHGRREVGAGGRALRELCSESRSEQRRELRILKHAARKHESGLEHAVVQAAGGCHAACMWPANLQLSPPTSSKRGTW